MRPDDDNRAGPLSGRSLLIRILALQVVEELQIELLRGPGEANGSSVIVSGALLGDPHIRTLCYFGSRGSASSNTAVSTNRFVCWRG